MVKKKTASPGKKIVLIGAGNVATHLGMALKKSGQEILQVYSRSKKSASDLANSLNAAYTCDLKQLDKHADIYVIAIKDDALVEIAKQIRFKSIVVHTSGSVEMTALKGCTSHYGVFYPLQSFSKARKIKLKNVPICIEASDKQTEKELIRLAEKISNRVIKIDSEKRQAIHLAAVFACNFSNHMYAIAEDILKTNQLPFQILQPLIKETAAKVEKNSPFKMQTGPAIRGDRNVMIKHINNLSEKKTSQAIYKLLSESIRENKN